MTGAGRFAARTHPFPLAVILSDPIRVEAHGVGREGSCLRHGRESATRQGQHAQSRMNHRAKLVSTVRRGKILRGTVRGFDTFAGAQDDGGGTVRGSYSPVPTRRHPERPNPCRSPCRGSRRILPSSRSRPRYAARAARAEQSEPSAPSSSRPFPEARSFAGRFAASTRLTALRMTGAGRFAASTRLLALRMTGVARFAA